MNETVLNNIQAYAAWKKRLSEVISRYRIWMSENEFSTPETDLRIFDLLDLLNQDTITIAFVAEFSRGKSELINAIFFADYKRRLLPSDVGRTTMCPTELFFDHQSNEAYLQLLPIETRLEDTSLAELKLTPMYWTKISLPIDSPDKMAETLKEVVKVKAVQREYAEQLGLLGDSQDTQNNAHQVDIPMWRHARISFPHPLLKHGLIVLDTPGLNALGSEPELTLNMLPNAQAILFILAADSGVTKSDLDMWQNHIMANRQIQKQGIVVVLNKIDALWDDLKDPTIIELSIKEQCLNTAKLLGMDAQMVLPVSAQKALLAKIKNDPALLEKTKIKALEDKLFEDILQKKETIIQDNIVAVVDTYMSDNHERLSSRFQSLSNQLTELRALSSENAEVLVHMMEKSRHEHQQYKIKVEQFQASRKVLSVQLKNMLNTMSLDQIDKFINKTRDEMAGSWTTMGLKNGMKIFFDSANQIMEEAKSQTASSFRMIESTYKKFTQEHGLKCKEPKHFLIEKYSREMEALYREGESYRISGKSTMTEQSFVIKKFFISWVSRARDIFFKLQKEGESWCKTILNPLADQLKERKLELDEKLDNLRKISRSRETVEQKINELSKELELIDKKLYVLNQFKQELKATIHDSLSTLQAQQQKSA